MLIDIITIFPSLFQPFLSESLMGKAIEKGLFKINIHDLRNWATDRHKTVDDAPFGGDEGMVFKFQPLTGALSQLADEKTRKIVMCPQGKRFDAKMARELAKEQKILVICGRYEGIDARIIKCWNLERVSIGDFVLSGGEVGAMALLESITRFVPDFVGRKESVENESFEDEGLLDYPVFTRPAQIEDMEDMAVPSVLLSGNHREIKRWRRFQRLMRTKLYRPDIFEKVALSQEDKDLMASDEWEIWP